MFKKNELILSQPKPFDEVGVEFIISGSIPISWLKLEYGSGFSNSLSLELLDTMGKTGMGSSIPMPRVNWLAKFFKILLFAVRFRFDGFFNPNFIQSAQGRIVIRLSGRNEKEQSLFIPLTVPELEPPGGPDADVIQRHGRVGEMIKQYEEDLINYYKDSEQIRASRKAKDDNKEPKYLYGQDVSIASEILKILEESEEKFEDYAYAEEDRREQELELKYKDALDWRGPLFHGIVSKFGGFELRVYSDDHDKHFHVIHKGKGINARFSFPEMRLISYVSSRNTIGSKEEQKIRELCFKPEVFAKLEKEFAKRTQS